MDDNTLRYFIAISLVKNLGHINAKKLIAVCGGPEAVFDEKRSALIKLNLRRNIVDEIQSKNVLDSADQEVNYLIKNDIDALTFHDMAYSKRLKQCQDAPLVIYIKGKVDFNTQKVLSIVGTRRASKNGLSQCSAIIKDLANLQVLVVSGLAYGIDTCAHEESLTNKLNTIAVLGHGMNRLYPFQNQRLAQQISRQGALITDFTSTSSMVPGNFPARNRIIAGLSDATVVIESGVSGGSLITADIANSYDREVFALPSTPGNIQSAGGNYLIKQNRAALIENANDIIKNLNWDLKEKVIQTRLFDDLNNDERIIIDILKEKNHTRLDEISRITRMSISRTSTVLLQLEFKNIIKSLPGKLYTLKT